MRDSADSYDPAYGRVRRAGKRQRKHFIDEETFTRRDRHLRRLVVEGADDATDGLPEGDRWSTWDQTEIPNPNDVRRIDSLPINYSTRGPRGIS